jgi:hypothetical protein
MSNGWSPQDIIREPIVVGASQTNLAISKDTGLSAGGAVRGLRIDFACTGVTDSTGITVKLQHRTLDNWTDLAGANASVAITADGEYSLKQLPLISADQPNFPLKKQLRVVVTTGAGDAVTFSSMRILQEL